jgi:hypothetical protein
MSKVTLEQVIEEVKSLTPEEQRQLRETLDKEARSAELRRIQDKYVHLTTNSEKQEGSKLCIEKFFLQIVAPSLF